MKDKVTQLIAGEKIEINPGKFQNDMTTLRSTDDILTLLVHLGYLTFDFYTKKVWIPNSEVTQEFINSIEDGGWEEVVKAIKISDELLKATLNCEEEKVAELIDHAHSYNTSIKILVQQEVLPQFVLQCRSLKPIYRTKKCHKEACF